MNLSLVSVPRLHRAMGDGTMRRRVQISVASSLIVLAEEEADPWGGGCRGIVVGLGALNVSSQWDEGRYDRYSARLSDVQVCYFVGFFLYIFFI